MEIFIHIILPMVAPALATVGILSFQAIWNDMSTSSLYIMMKVKEHYFFVQSLTAQQGNLVAGQGMAAAAGLMMFLPNFILFVILQRNVMNTMAHSGIK